MVNGFVPKALHTRRVGHLLVGDHTRNRRHDVHDSRRMVESAAEMPKVLGGRLHINLRLVLGVLRNLKVIQGDGAVFVQIVCAFQLRMRENLAGQGFPVIGKCARDIVAANTQEDLARFDRVAEARVDGNHAAGSKRNHRYSSRNIGGYGARYNQFRDGRARGCLSQGKLLRMVHFEDADVNIGDNLGLGGRLTR